MNDAPDGMRSRIPSLVVLVAGIALWVRAPFSLGFHPDRWWAFFLLVPAFWLLLPRDGVPASRGRVLAGAGAVGVAAVFLLTGGMGIGWPLLLVVVGLGGLLA